MAHLLLFLALLLALLRWGLLPALLPLHLVLVRAARNNRAQISSVYLST